MTSLSDLIEKFKPLEEKIGIQFNDKSLLITAFIHRSFLNENDWVNLPHNERMEFLGDAVLELITTNYLYNNYPKENEGVLTSWRSGLVNSSMLSKKAGELGFEEYLLLSKGEQKESGKARQFIMENCFESLIGAMYLDQGYEMCRKFVEEKLIKPEIENLIKNQSFLDAKSYFQEKAQEIVKITPTYKVLEESGPDHNKHFKIGVYLGEELAASGEGYSKKEAEEEAAKNAFKEKGWD